VTSNPKGHGPQRVGAGWENPLFDPKRVIEI
jgi:hypothetical protein